MKNLLFVTLILSLLRTEKIYCQEKLDSLIVFVGEKISVINTPNLSYQDTLVIDGDTMITVYAEMDAKYIATYKIIQQINGNYTHDTISFIVYDHYGKPAFSAYQNVLLFVYPIVGEFYHEKYQYFDVYQTKNGNWASPYKASEFSHPNSSSFTVQPEKIRFEDEISYDLTGLTEKEIKSRYPEPYYKVEQQKAKVVYGNYIEELFLIKQQGILKARGYN